MRTWLLPQVEPRTAIKGGHYSRLSLAQRTPLVLTSVCSAYRTCLAPSTASTCPRRLESSKTSGRLPLVLPTVPSSCTASRASPGVPSCPGRSSSCCTQWASPVLLAHRRPSTMWCACVLGKRILAGLSLYLAQEKQLLSDAAQHQADNSSVRFSCWDSHCGTDRPLEVESLWPR